MGIADVNDLPFHLLPCRRQDYCSESVGRVAEVTSLVALTVDGDVSARERLVNESRESPGIEPVRS